MSLFSVGLIFEVLVQGVWELASDFMPVFVFISYASDGNGLSVPQVVLGSLMIQRLKFCIQHILTFVAQMRGFVIAMDRVADLYKCPEQQSGIVKQVQDGQTGDKEGMGERQPALSIKGDYTW